MRHCPSCNRDLPDESFGVNRALEGGRSRTCKFCVREYHRAWRADVSASKVPRALKTADMVVYQREYWAKHGKKYNKMHIERDRKKKIEDPDYFREKWKREYENKQRRLHGADWRPKPKPTAAESLQKKRAQRKRKYLHRKEKYPEKVKAKAAVKRAVRKGILVRQPCWVCGDSKVHGHHPDYSAPLDVVWLCRAHHQQLHSEHPEKDNCSTS